MAQCSVPASNRRRLFWATQPDACGTSDICGAGCGIPGLSRSSSGGWDCAPGCQCCPPATVDPSCPDQIGERQQVTISTDQWLRGLVINMLMTDGRMPDTACGYRPGAQGGHWSSSYIEAGPAEVGTLIRAVPTGGRIQDSVNLATSYARATLQRLIERGVALDISVVGVYLGGMKMRLDIDVIGRRSDSAKVGISGQRVANGWVWS